MGKRVEIRVGIGNGHAATVTRCAATRKARSAARVEAVGRGYPKSLNAVISAVVAATKAPVCIHKTR